MDSNIVIPELQYGNFQIAKGEAKAIHPDEAGADHYQWAETGHRDYDTAL